VVKTEFFPFSPGLPWNIRNSIIIPSISDILWDNIIVEKKRVDILCPGYFLETLVSSKAVDILNSHGLYVKRWIIPSYYKDMLKFLGIDMKGSDGCVFEEFDRLMVGVKSYPVPYFFDGDGNMYLNLLFNYGKRVSFANFNRTSRNTEPFWKQLLDNICRRYDMDKFEIDTYKLKKKGLGLLRKLGTKKELVLLDNSNLLSESADGSIIKNSIFFTNEVRNIAAAAHDKGMECVVMGNRFDLNNGFNIFNLKTWNNINSLDMLCLLSCMDVVVSSDPNIYLVAALLGCPKVICLNDAVEGWRFEDIEKICVDKGEWMYLKDSSSGNIARNI